MRDLQAIVADNKAGKSQSKPMDPKAAFHADRTGGGQSRSDKLIRARALRERAEANRPWNKGV